MEEPTNVEGPFVPVLYSNELAARIGPSLEMAAYGMNSGSYAAVEEPVEETSVDRVVGDERRIDTVYDLEVAEAQALTPATEATAPLTSADAYVEQGELESVIDTGDDAMPYESQVGVDYL